MPVDLTNLEEEAENLAAQLDLDSLRETVYDDPAFEPAFEYFQNRFDEIRTSVELEDFVAEEREEGTLGLASWQEIRESARNFWLFFKRRLRRAICKEDGDLYDLSRSGTAITSKMLVGYFLAALGIAAGGPLAVAVVAAAAIVSKIGLNAFCEWSTPRTDASDDLTG